MNIRNTDRVFLVGTTGSGKTTLVKSLLWGLPHIVVLDSKRTFTLPQAWPKGWYIGDFRDHKEDDPRTLIYRPELEELDSYCEEFFAWVFARGNTLVYVDEVGDIAQPRKIGKGYDRCIRLGRERGVSVWSATQRPRFIPQVTMTESEHYFVFRLRSKEDRKIVGDFMSQPIVIEKPAEGHGFYYYNDRTNYFKYYRDADVGKVL